MDNAEAQFTTALRVSSSSAANICSHTAELSLLCSSTRKSLFLVFQLTTHQELWTYIVTNLASVYIREGNRHQEVSEDLI